MQKTKQHATRKWEVSFMELETEEGLRYKVTRKIPELAVSETKMFTSKERAKQQFEEWLR